MDAHCNVIWLMVLGTIADKCVLYKHGITVVTNVSLFLSVES